MNLGIQKFGTWMTALAVIVSGILSAAVHIHRPGEATGVHAGAGHSTVHFHFHSHHGDSPAHSHKVEPSTTNDHEIPFLPEHESDTCVVCQFLGDAGNLDALPVTAETLEISQPVLLRPKCWISPNGALCYQGRAPPCFLSI